MHLNIITASIPETHNNLPGVPKTHLKDMFDCFPKRLVFCTLWYISITCTFSAKEEYIKEFDLIMETGIKHKPNIEVRASLS